MYSKAAGKGSAYAWVPDCTIITHVSHVLVQIFVFDGSSTVGNESTFRDSWNLIPSAHHPLRLYALLDDIMKLFNREPQIISAVDDIAEQNKVSETGDSTLASLEDDSDID